MFVIKSMFLHKKWSYYQSNNSCNFVDKIDDAEKFKTYNEAKSNCTSGFEKIIKIS